MDKLYEAIKTGAANVAVVLYGDAAQIDDEIVALERRRRELRETLDYIEDEIADRRAMLDAAK